MSSDCLDDLADTGKLLQVQHRNRPGNRRHHDAMSSAANDVVVHERSSAQSRLDDSTPLYQNSMSRDVEDPEAEWPAQASAGPEELDATTAALEFSGRNRSAQKRLGGFT